jgi:sugar phosphate isomerase/epimerase
MKLAFSTLGCPHWGLKEIARAAQEFGYASIELRALGGSISLSERPELQPDAIRQTRAFFQGRNLSICCLDTSCSFDAIDEWTRRENIELAATHAELAAALGAPLIRVFPNEIPAGATRAETRKRIVESLRELAARVPAAVKVGLETHGDFAAGAATAEIIRLADHPQLVIIWDAANSFATGESVAVAASAVAPYLAHVHLRDARPKGEGQPWQPVLAGRGLIPFAEVIGALRNAGYDSYISFEWEKYWHPEIEEPEVALPDFAAAMRQLLNEESCGARTRIGSPSGG